MLLKNPAMTTISVPLIGNTSECVPAEGELCPSGLQWKVRPRLHPSHETFWSTKKADFFDILLVSLIGEPSK